MYYLRKESYEKIIPEIKKTDGTIIPERKYMIEDRALYKSTDCARFFRCSYPDPNQGGMKLYKCKRLSTIIEHRQILYNYCNEWFDVYDENGKVNIK